MSIQAPQIIMIILIVLELGIDLSRNGKAKEGKHSFGLSFVSSLMSIGILYWGGFFG